MRSRELSNRDTQGGADATQREHAYRALETAAGKARAVSLPSMPFRGRSFVLQAAIENERGRLVVDGGSWLISGPDCPPGTTVRVIGVDGARLKVVPEEPSALPSASDSPDQ